MNTQELTELSDENYGLLFDVRRSGRYHDRRRAFYEAMHKLTNFFTVLMAGSVLFDLAKTGETAWWLIAISIVAALIAVADMVFTYSEMAARHDGLRRRFGDLEIKMLTGPSSGSEWMGYVRERLVIEQDEPPVYVIVDGLCRNELLKSERGHPAEEFNQFGWWQTLTRNFFRWEEAETI